MEESDGIGTAVRLIEVLHVLALASYLFAWGVQLRAFLRGEGESSAPGFRPVLAGFALHLAGLVAFVAVYGGLPLVGLGPASATLSFILAAFVLGTYLGPDLRAAGLFLLPLLMALLGEAIYVGIAPASLQTGFQGPWFVVHVGTAFVGYAGLILASTAGAMYVLQFRSLKEKRFGSVFRYFPSLEGLDGLNRVGLAIGFPALTLGLVAGWSYTLTYGQGLALENPQVLLGVVTWVAYLGAIWARFRPTWSEERAAMVSTVAFLVTLLVFLFLRITVAQSPFFL